jgi:hypothetical protein
VLEFWTLWSMRAQLKAAARCERVLLLEVYEDLVYARVLGVHGATFTFEVLDDDEETWTGTYVYPIAAVTRICVDNVERVRERLLRNPENSDLL